MVVNCYIRTDNQTAKPRANQKTKTGYNTSVIFLKQSLDDKFLVGDIGKQKNVRI